MAAAERRGDLSHDFVVRWSQGTVATDQLRAARVTGRLRAAGYPAPGNHLAGIAPALGLVCSVQETIPGTPLGTRLDEPLLMRVLGPNTLQCRQAPKSFSTDLAGEAARHQRDRLRDMLMARIPPSLQGAHLAQLVLRQLDWLTRFHETATIAPWLRRGNEVPQHFTMATGR